MGLNKPSAARTCGRWTALSVFFLILSFPPFDVGEAAWIALVPWLIALEELTPRQAFWVSYLIGALFFGGTVWWIAYVTIPGLILLVAYLALYFAAWGWFARRLQADGSSWKMILALPGAWASLEFIRSILLSGFGWNLLAHTQWKHLAVIQIADLTGVYGVSFLVVLVNAAVYAAFSRASSVRRAILAAIVATACVAAACIYGTVRLAEIEHSPAPSPQFRVAVVQGNIPQTEKWSDVFQETIWQRYEGLTLEAAKRKPDIILWPETSVPDYLDSIRAFDRVRRVAQEAARPLLIGAPIGETESDRIFNGAAFFAADGTLLGRYDKMHLVPFGEYLPLTPVLGWLRRFVLMGDFSPGKDLTVFRQPLSTEKPIPPFSVLICFEDLFPGLTRSFARQGARWLVVITNDAWFRRSAASIQHLQASVFRAVEERMWVVRAANSGFSGFVAPTGRVLPKPEQVRLFRGGTAAAAIYPASDLSFYTAWADGFQIVALLCAGCAFLPTRKRIS